MREEVWGPGGERALGGGDAYGVHWEGPTQGWGGAQGTRGAHREHAAHGRDLGRVEALAERLVERRCALPSRSLRSNVTGLFHIFFVPTKAYGISILYLFRLLAAW